MSPYVSRFVAQRRYIALLQRRIKILRIYCSLLCTLLLLGTLFVLSTSCSLLVRPSTPATLDCRSLDCPSEADVDTAVRLFAERVPLDLTAQVIVEWHALGEVHLWWSDEAGEHAATSLTVSPDLVQVSDWRDLAHELMHVHLWRLTGNPDDAYHEARPGPWTAADNVLVNLVKNDFTALY